MKKKMENYFRSWEDAQLQVLEEKVTAEPEHVFSEDFEEKIHAFCGQTHREPESGKKRLKNTEKMSSRGRIFIMARTAVYAIAAVAAGFLVVICIFSEVRGLAAGWLDEFLHLQVRVAQEDSQEKNTQFSAQEDISIGMKEKRGDSGKKEVIFYTLIEMTEREYWNYLKENELSEEKGPSYIPVGYVLDQTGSWYGYIWNEKEDDEFDDSKNLSEAFPDTGFAGIDRKHPKKAGEAVDDSKNADEAVLEKIHKTWKHGKYEINYYETVHDWTKSIQYPDVKSCEKILIGEKEAYLVKESDGTVFLHVYQETSLVIFSGRGEDGERMCQELIKMAESLFGGKKSD